MHKTWKLAAALLIGAGLLGVPGNLVQAKGTTMTAQWVPAVFSVDNGTDRLSAEPQAKREITQVFTAKLKDLQAKGKLPFELKESSNLQLNGIQEDYEDTVPIGIVPIVLLDQGLVTKYHVGDKDFYKAVITSGMNVAVCSGDKESGKWRVLAVVPMNAYSVLGRDPKHLITSPLTHEQMVNEYTQITKEMINKDLDFKPVARALKDWDKKQLTADTYQVDDVKISSKKAQQVFHGHGVEIRNVIGNFYTTAFQQKTGHVVFPPKMSAQFKEDVTNQLYSCEMNSDSGSINLEMEKPKHSITLDFSGANWADVVRSDPSDIRKDTVYKAWLTVKQDGKPDRTESDYSTQEYFLKEGNSLEVDPRDIYTGILIKLSQNMAKQEK